MLEFHKNLSRQNLAAFWLEVILIRELHTNGNLAFSKSPKFNERT
jgi:hypothetical protein